MGCTACLRRSGLTGRRGISAVKWAITLLVVVVVLLRWMGVLSNPAASSWLWGAWGLPGNGGVTAAAAAAATSREDEIHVVFCSDWKMLRVASAAVNSSVVNASRPERLVFHFLLPHQANRALFETQKRRATTLFVDWIGARRIEVHEVDVGGIVDNMMVRFDGVGPDKAYLKNEMNYARFSLPDVLPDLDKILYLDPDIVVRGDLCELWDSALRPGGRLALAAVERRRSQFWLGNPTLGGMLDFSDAEIRAKFKPKDAYFNAGVFLARLRTWKLLGYSDEMIRWMEVNAERPIYKFGSQPPMNLVFYRKYEKLEPRWNVAPGTTKGGDKELKEGRAADDAYIAEAAIIHWSGNRKPWLESTAELPTGRYRHIWWRYFTRSDEVDALLGLEH